MSTAKIVLACVDEWGVDDAVKAVRQSVHDNINAFVEEFELELTDYAANGHDELSADDYGVCLDARCEMIAWRSLREMLSHRMHYLSSHPDDWESNLQEAARMRAIAAHALQLAAEIEGDNKAATPATS